MKESGFLMCAECINKKFHDIDKFGRRRYYYSKIDGIIRDGLVLDSTDASACVKWGLFQRG